MVMQFLSKTEHPPKLSLISCSGQFCHSSEKFALDLSTFSSPSAALWLCFSASVCFQPSSCFSTSFAFWQRKFARAKKPPREHNKRCAITGMQITSQLKIFLKSLISRYHSCTTSPRMPDLSNYTVASECNV